jgi:hypothetical protein
MAYMLHTRTVHSVPWVLELFLATCTIVVQHDTNRVENDAWTSSYVGIK